MTDNQYKTQCPHCATQFKLSEKQLAQAGGMVRCGSCLKPFQARDHLVDEAPPARPVAKPAAAPAPQADDEDAWAKALLDAEAPAPKAAPAPAAPAKTGSRWQMPEEAPKFTAADDTLSLGEAIEMSDELDSIEAGGFTDFNGNDFGDVKGAGRGNQSADSDEDWARALLEEAEAAPAAKSKPSAKPTQTPAKAAPKPASKPSNRPERQAPASLFDFDDSELDLMSVGNDTRRHQYQDAMARAGHDATSQFIKWGSLSLLMLVLLGGQYLLFNFQSLARTASLRPFYQQVCQLLQCQLPPLSSTNLLQATNLLVRSLDDQPGVLLVDLLLHNEANHAQPFPRLELAFRDTHGQLLAAGVFNPDQYLQNGLAGMQNLPPQAQVHLSFRITDPGEGAKSYALQLLPPGHA